MESGRSIKTMLYVTVVCHVIARHAAEVLYIHCQGPADLGGLDKVGFYYKSCIQNEEFVERKHAWNFKKSVIQHSTFTSCVFTDTAKRKQQYEGSYWRNVTFQNCEFGDDTQNAKHRHVIGFSKARFRDVMFDGCVFHASAEMVFTSFSFETVTFNNCTFLGDFRMESGNVDRLGIVRSVSAPYTENAAWGNLRSSFQLSKVRVSRMRVWESRGGAYRLQEATVSDIVLENTTVESLACHEQVRDGETVTKSANMQDTFLSNVTILDGMFCGHGRLDGLEMHNVKIGRVVDLRYAEIERLAVLNMSVISGSKRGTLTLAHSTIGGQRLAGLGRRLRLDVSGAVFEKGMNLQGVNISCERVYAKETIFMQERISRRCCTEVCATKGCKCDVSQHSLTGCAVGNSSVNVNVKDSCFPNDARVTTLDDDSSVRSMALQDVKHGTRLQTSGTQWSAVYFFGHRAATQHGVFRVISGHDTRTHAEFRLTLSAGHTLAVWRGVADKQCATERAVAARTVRSGDEVRLTSGGRGVVTRLQWAVKQGLHAPTTLAGVVGVDGVVVSCYTDAVAVRVAHAALTPLRAAFRAARWARCERIVQVAWLHRRSAAPFARALAAALRALVRRVQASV